MANILFLIDTQLNECCESNNWIVYNDNVENVINSLVCRHNDCEECSNDWPNSLKESLINMVKEFYENHILSVPTDVIQEHITVKVLDDDLMCIPNKNISYMFIFNDNAPNTDYRVIEGQIAGYALKLILEDFDYERLEWRGHTYHGEDIGYSMTERAESRIQNSTIFLKDGSSVTMDCYQIRNYVS